MSATFLHVKGGGWVNAAHIRHISEQDVATVPTANPNNDHFFQLEEDWANPEYIIEVTEDRPV